MTTVADRRHVAYSPAEAAAQVGLSRERIRQHILTGRLPAKRDGRRYLITHADLERFVESLPAATAIEPRGPASEETEAATAAAPVPSVVVGRGPTGAPIAEHGPGAHTPGPR